MKKLKIGIVTAVVALSTAFLSISCSEETTPSHVWGAIYSNVSTGYIIDGSMDKKSARYYGSCEEKDDKFNFIVGSDDRNHLTGNDAFYLSIMGIEGPPVEGVYEEGSAVEKDDKSYWRGFSDAIFASVNEWSFKQDDSEVPGECMVRLYATAKSGELVSDERGYGFGKERFDYFVHFLCPQLSEEPDMGGTILKSVDATLWFKDCD